ncbi:MAG: CooT family nickel-binding protein [Thermococcus sp.]|uniref:RNA-binding protein n=1 Tax=Thermococcus guaymasensis DSM 11113 TaxID=1432656 RepID=A0A0X1KKF0_9EURY|nr:CooT family nickel-binding protein [Thermococcus guaymasensis]AJC71738.1 RNA-binding protein [Thermococcus guaymasensis DSM 11113]MCD6523748.1 CooT family nickel-binding protein [Thermococcus sp.]
MCQSKVILLNGNGAEVIMTDVVLMDVKDDGRIEIMDIMGNRKTLRGCRVESVDFISHKVFLKEVI